MGDRDVNRHSSHIPYHVPFSLRSSVTPVVALVDVCTTWAIAGHVCHHPNPGLHRRGANGVSRSLNPEPAAKAKVAEAHNRDWPADIGSAGNLPPSPLAQG